MNDSTIGDASLKETKEALRSKLLFFIRAGFEGKFRNKVEMAIFPHMLEIFLRNDLWNE